jgi:hypothetical protein
MVKRVGPPLLAGERHPRPQSQADVDDEDGRDETENERMDRNWGELLQELRATQTGIQILSGFLLTVAFQQRFQELDTFQHTVYLILVVIAATTILFGLAPVNLHRALFREHLKPRIVSFGHIALRLQLLGVGVIVTGTVLLIFDVVAGRVAGVLAGVLVAALVVCVALVPRLAKSRG